MREVLLCPPAHYRWIPANTMARTTLAAGGQPADPAGLMAQHAELEDALRQAQVAVRMLQPEPHLPYMVYTRDSSVMGPWGALLCQLQRPERRGEYASLLEFYQARAALPDAADGPALWKMSSAGTLEGGDIHIIRPGLALIGESGGRTDAAGAAQLAGWLREAGWDVRVQPFDEHFLHLDVLFSMVTPEMALACTSVLPEDFLLWAGQQGIRLLPVSYQEAMQLGCNVISLGGGRVISAQHNRAVNAALRAEGLEVLDPALSLFTAGGGGPHCLTCPLWREEEP